MAAGANLTLAASLQLRAHPRPGCFQFCNKNGNPAAFAGFGRSGGHKLAGIFCEASCINPIQEAQMLTTKVMRTTALTLACAMGIGLYMQTAGQDPLAGAAAQQAARPQLPGEPGPAQLQIDNITLTSAPAADLSAAAEAPQAAACRISASAEPVPAAMVDLSVSAPCQAGERLTVHHSGISFTARLDQAGAFRATVPALARTAVFIAETSTGQGAVAVAEVEGLDSIDRVVLQWSGNSGFEIHAREFGAAYGSDGHIWHGAEPGAGAGSLVRLGDDSQLAPRIAEVYSLPRSLPGQSGAVALSAEAEVTAINCGRDITAQALQLRGGRLSSRDLVMAMPDCGAQGSFLVLNNLVEDLKIASN